MKYKIYKTIREAYIFVHNDVYIIKADPILKAMSLNKINYYEHKKIAKDEIKESTTVELSEIEFLLDCDDFDINKINLLYNRAIYDRKQSKKLLGIGGLLLLLLYFLN